jgi:hypothetical protein
LVQQIKDDDLPSSLAETESPVSLLAQENTGYYQQSTEECRAEPSATAEVRRNETPSHLGEFSYSEVVLPVAFIPSKENNLIEYK